MHGGGGSVHKLLARFEKIRCLRIISEIGDIPAVFVLTVQFLASPCASRRSGNVAPCHSGQIVKERFAAEPELICCATDAAISNSTAQQLFRLQAQAAAKGQFLP